ncbi:hypothetical protein C0W92_07130 [Photobacterium angustum]|uniref:Uncharacterized protein n=1 Tax=Photobacterium angustum TaxID=661 RepID=A0A0D8PKB5_PHOAN|nr:MULTISPECIES: hypothetical protein [Photobacterium]KJF82452.1 threonyl-tRNA synthetase [Photobacterium damselae subsp. damselae]KJF94625.1 threonyl-tRNA synthetase [Photobacterium angustum]KJG03345.1 threonyl-tRNA synthetase [Photobacterium angustum]KJG07848.1 threonyl-tRNA synthetase [Photobacterium angustum]KJG18975.1 threonyl-tRNA synthetase [Photobacterium angustum]
MSFNSGATHQVAHVEFIKLSEAFTNKKRFTFDTAILSGTLKEKRGCTIANGLKGLQRILLN